MSTLARELLAQIDGATRAGDPRALRQAMARCATAVAAGEFEAGEAGLILVAAQEAYKAIRDGRGGANRQGCRNETRRRSRARRIDVRSHQKTR